MNYIIETILDLLFPRRCPVCGQIIMPKGNLIYTAVTRASSCVCLVGRPDAFYTMADNSMEQKRYCGLKARIEEIYA